MDKHPFLLTFVWSGHPIICYQSVISLYSLNRKRRICFLNFSGLHHFSLTYSHLGSIQDTIHIICYQSVISLRSLQLFGLTDTHTGRQTYRTPDNLWSKFNLIVIFELEREYIFLKTCRRRTNSPILPTHMYN